MSNSISFTVQGESEISSFLKAVDADRYFRFEPASRIQRPIYVIDGKAYPFGGIEIKTKALFVDEFPDGNYSMNAPINEVVLISKGKRITITSSAPRVEIRKSGRMVFYCDGKLESSSFTLLSAL
jgi:hypothetical protein